MNQVTDFLDTYFKGDKVIWTILFILGMLSLLAVYSASGYATFRGGHGSAESHLFKQSLFLVFGFGLAYLTYKVHYMYYSRWAPYMYLVAIVLMFYTTFFGVEINNARRWMSIPIFDYNFQTSDFARFAVIVLLARTLAIKQKVIKGWKNAFLPIMGYILMMCALIAPPDLSTSALLFVTCVVMMFIGRVNMKYILLLIVSGILVFILIYYLGSEFPEYFRKETWDSRINEFINGTEYQVQQSKIAIANGGLFGKGIGGSLQRNHLPYAYADFIYAIICEEYGILGAVIVILCYFVLLWRTLRIVMSCKKAFGTLLAMGLSLNIVIQAYANIAVSVNLIPATGFTLPMISMGGSSLLLTCISFGIILSVSRYVEESKDLNKMEKKNT